ncbi:hypothetical protein B0H10DRAFT_1345501 [Mycena sp. CBHHK59/15]|nr:hypothetical protein B0H10DRAFT_1345501 [Mycena sp. CBHHK59/15]
MAQVSPVASDSASESGKNKKDSPSKAKEGSEVEDSEAQSDGGEEEYEIEEILDAKKGRFANNKLGYLVKWKGYTEADNSWVIEDDAANATELIAAFWEKKKKRTAAKKAAASPKRPRKSVAEDDASDAGSISVVAKKRGRKSVSKAIDVDEEDDDVRPAKRAKKSVEKRTPVRALVSEPPEDDVIGNMSEHMHAPTWDQLIKQIDTVERVDNKLYVYFTLKENGERIREESDICADKFPKMLIKFYESNLRWKEADQ